MKNNIAAMLLAPLLAITFVTRAQANPWWWPVKSAAKSPTKTVQLALPSTNGTVVSVTLPSKTTAATHINGHWSILQFDARRAHASNASQKDDERIAADLERHF